MVVGKKLPTTIELNTSMTPPLTACARRLKPAEKLVKDRIWESCTSCSYTSSCIGMIVFCTYTLHSLEDLASTGDTVDVMR